MNKIKNCCDGAYNSFDVHFTEDCDNRCKHCIDTKYNGIGVRKPDIKAIAETIIKECDGIDDVLFLGGEPCLYLQELYDCIMMIKEKTELKIFITTGVPKTCYDNKKLFYKLIEVCDGINLSVQHYKENIADAIRCTKSKYDRQRFYRELPMKEKIRINLNIVKPFLYKKDDIVECLKHYDAIGFNSIKLSEIQHGKDVFVSFEKVFNKNYGSPFTKGCQKYIDPSIISIDFKTPILLKRSCFACEETLKANLSDGVKVVKKIFVNPKNKYGVIYENGEIKKGWV